MIQLRINGSLINFGHIPARDVNITEIELTTPPSHFNNSNGKRSKHFDRKLFVGFGSKNG